jgi:hypothetical protein
MNNNKFGSADYTSAVPMSSGYNNAPPPPAPPTSYNDERGPYFYYSLHGRAYKSLVIIISMKKIK